MRKLLPWLIVAGVLVGLVIAYYLIFIHGAIVCDHVGANSASTLGAIAIGVRVYSQDYSQFPPDLDAMAGYVPPEGPVNATLESGRKCDFFYHRPAKPPSTASPMTIIACDLLGNQEDGRFVVHLDASVSFLTHKQFEAELAKGENADFAAAFREAGSP